MSTAATAYPSMTARVKWGTSPAATTSAASGRPSASRMGTVSAGPGRSHPKASRTSRVPATWKKPVAPLRSLRTNPRRISQISLLRSHRNKGTIKPLHGMQGPRVVVASLSRKSTSLITVSRPKSCLSFRLSDETISSERSLFVNPFEQLMKPIASPGCHIKITTFLSDQDVLDG